jgi:hypothetical protein
MFADERILNEMRYGEYIMEHGEELIPFLWTISGVYLG